MKLFQFKRTSVLRCSAVICLAAVSVYAQSPAAGILLELKTCGREQQIFEDGTVRETWGNVKTERKISGKRMLKLRKVLENNPCEIQRRQTLPANPSGQLNPALISPGTISDSDCIGNWRSAMFGMQEVVVRHHTPGRETWPFPAYIVCPQAKGEQKKHATLSLKNSTWPRFLADVQAALGGKSILKDCKCGY